MNTPRKILTYYFVRSKSEFCRLRCLVQQGKTRRFVTSPFIAPRAELVNIAPNGTQLPETTISRETARKVKQLRASIEAEVAPYRGNEGLAGVSSEQLNERVTKRFGEGCA